MYVPNRTSLLIIRSLRIHVCFWALFLFWVASAAAVDVGGPIEVDTVWSAGDSPFNLVDDIRVSEGATLTIEPNVQVHLNHHAFATHWPGFTLGYLTVSNASFHGSSSPTENLFIRPTDSVENCEFLGVRLVLNADGGILQHNYFSTDLYGIMAQGEWVIYDCEFENCAVGIWFNQNLPLTVSNCSFVGCDEGFHFFDFEGFPEIEIHYCNFYLPGYGIFVDGSPTSDFIDASQNYWGHESGPTHPDNPAGGGAAIGDGVQFDPWLQEPAPPPTGIRDDVPIAEFILHQNSPNPFNPITTISFDLLQTREAKLMIYSLTGQTVATLLDAQLGPGRHDVSWSGRDDTGQEVASGTYIYRLEVGDQAVARQLVLVR